MTAYGYHQFYTCRVIEELMIHLIHYHPAPYDFAGSKQASNADFVPHETPRIGRCREDNLQSSEIMFVWQSFDE